MNNSLNIDDRSKSLSIVSEVDEIIRLIADAGTT